MQDVAASKLKSNLYFLISQHTQSNKHILWLRTQSVTNKNWMKYCSVRDFVSCTTFNLREYISVNTAIAAIFNLNINHVYVYNIFLNLLLQGCLIMFFWAKTVVCCHSTNYVNINAINWIFWILLTMANYRYKPKFSQSLTS